MNSPLGKVQEAAEAEDAATAAKIQAMREARAEGASLRAIALAATTPQSSVSHEQVRRLTSG